MAEQQVQGLGDTPAIEPVLGKFADREGVCSICGKPALHKIGSTCQKHLGKMGLYYVRLDKEPDAKTYMPLTKLCDLAEACGKSRTWCVNLTGGDGGTRKPADGFTVYVWGKRKYTLATAATALKKLAKGK